MICLKNLAIKRMESAAALIVSLVCALSAAFFAQDRGRDPLNWYFIGLFLGIFGIVALFFLSNKGAEGKGT